MRIFLPTTCLRDHESSTRSTGRNFLPKGVKEYSTRTGISVNICRFTSPSRSSSRNCSVKTFCEIRGMLWRRVLKRSGFLDSKSHQRITGFQRPPINTSSCSIGHMLAINLALISAPVTRYPFGAWYLLDDTKQMDHIPARRKRHARSRTPDGTRNCECRTAWAKKNCITGATWDIQATGTRVRSRYPQYKTGQVGTASLFPQRTKRRGEYDATSK